MEPIVIDLEPNYLYWQELYFANGNDTLLESPGVKSSYEYLKLCSVVVVVVMVICYYQSDLMDTLLGALFFFAVCLLYFLKNLRAQYIWRKATYTYLEEFKNIKSYQVILFQEGILSIRNGEKSQIEWSTIDRVERTKRALRIHRKNRYLSIPQKAMSPSDFELLVSFAENKMQELKRS